MFQSMQWSMMKVYGLHRKPWQSCLAELFGVGIPAINKHLKNIFSDGELNEKEVVSKMEITTLHGAIEGKTQAHETKFYNLDAIISVGYRVNSRRATAFRIWATSVLFQPGVPD